MASFQDTLGDTLGGMFSGSLTVVTWVVAIILSLVVVSSIIYYFFIYKKKFDILVKIQSERSNDPRIFFDNGAIFYDRKDKEYYVKLLNLKKTIEIPNFKFITHTNRGDYIELFRVSENDFRFLSVPTIDKEYMLRRNGKLFLIDQMKVRQVESDVSWILNRQKKNKSILTPESVLMKLLEYAPQIISAIFSLMVLYVIFKYAPQVMASFSDLAEAINKDKQSVQVVGSMLPLLWLSGKR